jgi:hypothetical protein
MEAISLSMLVSAVSAAIVSGAKGVTENAVKDTYSALKSKIGDSKAYREVLKEELQRSNVLAYESLQNLTAQLIKVLQQTEQGESQFTKFLNQGETNVGAQGDQNTFYGDAVGKK